MSKKKSTREQSGTSRGKVKIKDHNLDGDTTAKCCTARGAKINLDDIYSFGAVSGIVDEDVLCLESQYSHIRRILSIAQGKIINGYKVRRINFLKLISVWDDFEY